MFAIPLLRPWSAKSIAAGLPTCRFASSPTSLPMKSSANSLEVCPAWLPRKSPSFAPRAPGSKRSGAWTMTAPISTSSPTFARSPSRLAGRRTLRFAFTCYEPYKGLVSAQICMYSLDTSKLIAFPRFPGTNITPAWSPDGTQIIFSSSMQGNPELYVCDVNCNRPKRLTQSSGANMSPSWNPKTGQTIAFVSDQGGNERPSWAPDGRHLVFESTRSGERQIWTMLADGSQAHQLTTGGHNESPNWSTH